jgi:biotin carboxylase
VRRLVHILGGGPYQVPTIRRAKQLGLEVLVTDMYQERPGYLIADRHEVIDVVDRERTLEAARRHAVDAVLCDSIDIGVPTAAYVAEQLGLPGIPLATAERFTDKYRMRQSLADAGIESTRLALVGSLEEADAATAQIGFPVVVKPPDSQGSRGVRRVRGPAELADCFAVAQRYSRCGRVIVEEYLEGTEVIVDSLCLGGEVTVLAFGDKVPFGHRPETARRITYPAALDPASTQALIALNQSVVQALGLTNGLTHGEYKVCSGGARLIEIGARGGGAGIFSEVLPHLTGLDLSGIVLDLAFGRRPEPKPAPEGRAANLLFFELPAGRLVGLDGLEEARALPGVRDIVITLRPGDRVAPPQDDTQRPGPAIVLGATRAEVLAISERLERLVRARVA